jgi:hypothetical protein
VYRSKGKAKKPVIDFELEPKNHVALKIAYLGQNYGGFAI